MARPAPTGGIRFHGRGVLLTVVVTASVVRQKSFDIRLRIDGWQFFLLRRNVSVAQTGALHMNAGGVETYLADADAAGDSGDRRRNSHWLERFVR